MSTPVSRPLPERPDLQQFRRQARELLAGWRASGADDLARVADYRLTEPTLTNAQLVLAREYGFASWTRLRQYLATIAEFTWDSPVGATPEDVDPADRFCRLACLTYGRADDPGRWRAAAELLTAQPELVFGHPWAAAAAGRADVLATLLAADPGLARRRGGPYGWTPLFYLAYSRVADAGAEPVRSVRLLLGAGADPDEGYLWNGGPYAFTVLTGLFGEGELGPVSQPPHPRAADLAALLLAAGADPNDSQSLYNRMFEPGTAHLELLFAHGLGRGDGGPWQRRLPEALPSPTQMLADQLRWAVEHDFADRVELLLAHDVPADATYSDGHSALQLAELSGHTTIATMLRSAGAAARLDPVEELIAAVMRADTAAVDRLCAADPELPARARAARPGLLVWAVARSRPAAVPLLLDLGFDVNALARSDVPREQEWETALHVAARHGDLELVERLLAAGADPTIRDCRFDGTPADWAEYFGQSATADRLRAASTGEEL